MELENFKSYAGTQSIGPFHKSFSSIVGPNGSGKSNVIDALLFVFGKKANKLRLNNISELIHKSSRYPDFEYARVSVYFQLIVDTGDGDDDYEVVPNSEFTITRIVEKGNASKYLVDDKKSSFTAVGQLLRGYGVDLDNNRFLILQGEVEQISMMKPKALTPHEEGLLGYLEDIIGSNQYIEQIEEASKKLDSINDQRVEKVNRLKVAEKDRDNLLDSKVEAESYIEKEKNIRRKKNILYQLNERSAAETAQQAKAKVDKIQDKVQIIKAEKEAADKRRAEIERDYESVKAERTRIEKELNSSTTQYDAFERKDVKLQEDMKHSKANIKKFQAVVAKEAKKEVECVSEADTALTQVTKYRNALTDFEAKKVEEEAQLSAIMESLQEGTSDLREALEASQQRLAESEKAVSSLQSDKDLVSNAITLLQSRPEKARKLLQQTQEKLEGLQRSRAEEADKMQAASRYEIDIFQPKQRTLQKQITDFEQEEKKLQDTIREAVVLVEQHRALLDNKQHANKANNTVQQILKAARLGGALSSAGVRGRLGDLATISPEYDTAVTTACRVLDHIVVETPEGAQQCVEFLRKMNIGRASFIVLSLMDEYRERMSRKFTAPGQSGEALRLFDLIENLTSEDLRPVWYMALRDTLVSKDLETAVRIAYVGDRAQYRVVTMDGQVIDTSGAMSGGGRDVRKGGMRLTTATAAASKGGKANKKLASTSATAAEEEDDENVSAQSIAREEAAIAEWQQELAQIRQQKDSLKHQLSSLQDDLKSAQVDLQKAQMALRRFEEHEREYVEKIQTLSREAELTTQENRELQQHQQRLEALEAQISTVAPDLRVIQQEAASLQRQILSFGGPKLAKAQARVDSIIHQIETVSSSLSTKEVEESSLRKQAEKARQAKEKAEQDVLKAEEKMAQLTAEQAEMENDALQVVQAVENARSALADLEESMSEASRLYQEIQAAVQKSKANEVDLQVELDRASHEAKEQAQLAQQWRKESETIRAQHLEEEHEFARTVKSLAEEQSAAVAASAAAAADTSSDGNTAMDVDGDDADQQASNNHFEVTIEELPRFNEEDLDSFRREELLRDITLLETERNKLKGNVNMNALLDYLRKDHVYRLRLKEVESLNRERSVLKDAYEALRRQRLELFMAGFGQISLRLKEMYQMITLGGDAELELLDSLDPFSEGIAFSVRPPKKSWKQIGNLSGGEKTLASLALVFALHYYKPTPLYVMDEIDAALDFKNVSIVANYIKERTKDAQFIIISLRNNMFELADRLVGIYKTHDATKSVTINPKVFQPLIASGEEAQQNQVASAGKASTSKVTANNSSSILGDVTNQQLPK
jgi:structural maintenance of chromosome 4